jgi:hypothetical protein
MAMKDISALDELERAVREAPELITDAHDRIDEQLESGSRAKRMDAGRALRAAAEYDAELVVPYEETLVGFLSTENDSLRLSGALGVAELAAVDPESHRKTVPALVETLETTAAPAIEEAVLRALTRVGMSTPEAVATADPVVAGRLPEATRPTQTSITKSFVGVVREEPTLFEETITAYADAVEAESEPIPRFAAEALATVASADPSALPTPERVMRRVEALAGTFDADPRPWVGRDVRAAVRALGRANERRV